MKKNVLVGLILASVLSLAGCSSEKEIEEMQENRRMEGLVASIIEEESKNKLIEEEKTLPCIVKLRDAGSSGSGLVVFTATDTVYIYSTSSEGTNMFEPLLNKEGKICTIDEYRTMLKTNKTLDSYKDVIQE